MEKTQAQFNAGIIKRIGHSYVLVQVRKALTERPKK